MDNSKDNDCELMLLRQQMGRQVVLTVAIAVVAIAALAWGLVLTRAASRRTQQLRHVSAVVDSLDRVAAAQRQRINPIEARIQSFGTLQSRLDQALGAKANRSDVAGLRAQLDAIALQLAHTDSAVTRLNGEIGRHADQLAAAQIDSLSSLRRSLGIRLAALADTARGNRTRLKSLTAHVAAIDASRTHERTWTAVRDVATGTALAMITAHVVDHGGR